MNGFACGGHRHIFSLLCFASVTTGSMKKNLQPPLAQLVQDSICAYCKVYCVSQYKLESMETVTKWPPAGYCCACFSQNCQHEGSMRASCPLVRPVLTARQRAASVEFTREHQVPPLAPWSLHRWEQFRTRSVETLWWMLCCLLQHCARLACGGNSDQSHTHQTSQLQFTHLRPKLLKRVFKLVDMMRKV